MNAKSSPPPVTIAALAKAALRRLAQARLEPTPDNFRKAYLEESGQSVMDIHGGKGLYEQMLQRGWPDLKPNDRLSIVTAMCEDQWTQVEQRLRAVPPPDGSAWADLIDKAIKGVSRSNKQWTTARRKDSLQRVLTGSRSDAERLQQRLRQLIVSWDAEGAVPEDSTDGAGPLSAAPAETPESMVAVPAAAADPATGPMSAEPLSPLPDTVTSPVGLVPVCLEGWPDVVQALADTVHGALPRQDARGHALSARLLSLRAQLAPTEAVVPPLVLEWAQTCQQAQRLIAHRHHLTDQLGVLARELTASLAELSEDDSWAQGQCAVMHQHLEDGLTARSVRSVSQLLDGTRMRQHQLRQERLQAREALKQAIHQMLSQIGELDTRTGSFEDSISRYADQIGAANSLESLADVVQSMVDETRAVHGVVSTARQRLQEEHARATVLSERVQTLEAELRRISEEVATDPLTQVANRRGLMQAFEVEQARVQRDGDPLTIGLLDIDNFKRLNDQLGHNTGDAALKFLAEKVKQSLRPGDTLARWGGEEFVVLLPATQTDDGQQILSRLQRVLSAELFMHEGQKTFVTFSAGVTAWRTGEPLEEALERADEALYEAKRTGKNRTCMA